jgi:FtsH-binding integral membrane protein
VESISTGLYDAPQSGVDTISRRAFMFAISAFTTLNILVAALGASFSIDWTFWNNKLVYLGFLLACVAVSIGGAFLAHMNDEPTTSIFGGFICAGAMGVMVGPFVGLYEAGSVLQAFTITTGIVVLTGFIGAMLPQNLSMWAAPLFGCLLGLIVLQLVVPLVVSWLGLDYELALSVLDIAGIVLFSAIMVYDLNKAKWLDKTLDNAIDVAVNVFLNFANIFIRVLAWTGQMKK